MLRWTLVRGSGLSFRILFECNRSRTAEKIHYSESFSAGKTKLSNKISNKQPPKSQTIFSFLFFPFLISLCMNCSTQESLNNSEIRTCLSHLQLQFCLFLDPPRRKPQEGTSPHIAPLKAQWEFQCRQSCHARGTHHVVGPLHHS